MTDALEQAAPRRAEEVRYRRAADALWRVAGDGILVLARGAHEPVAVLGAGRALWEILEPGVTVTEAAALLGERFQVSEDDVRSAIEPVLQDLFAFGAVETAT